jgi:hypothetical protein
VTIPSLPSLAMVVYNPFVEPVQDPNSTKALPALPASSTGKSSYPMSSLGNFTPFFTLTNDDIMYLIEDYGVVFHTSNNKKTQIIKDIKAIEFKKFSSFLEGLLSVLQ